MLRLISATLVLLVALTSFACRPRVVTDASMVMHDAGKPVQSADPWYWAEIDRDDFLRVVAAYLELGGADKFLPANRKLTMRMQHWIDLIHERVKAAYPAQLVNVPAPRVYLWLDSEANAFIPPVATCFNLKLAFGGNKQGAVVERATLYPNGDVRVDESNDLCIRRDLSDAQKRAFIAWMNSRMQELRQRDLLKGNCVLSLEGQDTVRAGPGCEIGTALRAYSGAKQLVFWQAPNAVVVHAGLVPFFDSEEKIISTLAHELGHYYRSHVAVPTEQYAYFYRLGSHNSNHAPTPDNSLGIRGRRVLAAAAETSIGLETVSGQHFDSSLVPFLLNLAPQVCLGQRKCSNVCNELTTLVGSDDFAKDMGDFPGDKLSAEGEKAYSRFESLLLSCGKSITVVTRGSTLTADQVADYLNEANQLHGTGFASVEDASGQFGNKSLDQVLNLIEAGAKTLSQQAPQLINDAIADNIGFYTIEQEADDISIEFEVLLGLDPARLTQLDIDFYRGSDQGLGFDMNRCAQLASNNWEENGVKRFPPIADYYDDHHTACFRIFNSFQEITAHNYDFRKFGPAPTFLSDAEWKKLGDDAGHLISHGWLRKNRRLNGSRGRRTAARIRSPSETFKSCFVYTRALSKSSGSGSQQQ